MADTTDPASNPPPFPGPASAPGPGPAASRAFSGYEFNNKIRNVPSGQLFTTAPTKYSREDWFLYFWMEAKSSFQQHANFQQSKKVREFFGKYFDKGPDFDKDSPDFISDSVLVPRLPFENNGSDREFFGYMKVLLEVGFASIDLSSDDTASDMGRFRLMQDEKLKASIFWRSEGRRGLEQLREQGYEKQALDTSGSPHARRAAINCDQSWHPFSVPEVSKRIWYRRASSDNCWYTGVSVASQWETAVCYPKIGQTPRLQLVMQNQGAVDDTLQRAHPDLIGEVEFIDGSTKLAMITKSKIAMILIDTPMFDTQAKQAVDKSKDEAYDEKAVSRIAGRNVIALVEFWRVHHGGLDSDGFTAVVDRTVAKKTVQVIDLIKILGDFESAVGMREQIDQAYSEAFRSKQISVRWDSTGWKTVDSIGQVKAIRLNGRQVY